MEAVVNGYISSEIVQDRELLPLANDASLLEGGILDSLSLVRLVVFLEETFQVTVGEADLIPENFDTVDAICAYLRAREQERRGAAHG
jgi:acyl carrier protein